jgi:choline dehydrogenase-like flavoprotein
MRNSKYDYLIVGSGAAGATLAKELAQRKKSVLVVEAGKNEKKIGTSRDALRYYDLNRIIPLPRKSKEGVTIWRTLMAGGSTVVSCGNGVRCLEKELGDFGIDLSQEFIQAEQEMHIAPIAERLLSNGSKAIMLAAKELGYDMKMMPKFIDPKLCRKCGHCTQGCTKGAKWTALGYLEDAIKNGAQTSYETRVKEIMIDNGKAKGIRCVDREGIREIFADAVILAAGGIGTPIILQNSGIKDAGTGLFVDLYVKVYGVTDNDKLNQVFEPMMPLVNLDFHQTRGFILSPFVSHTRMTKFLEFGLRGFTLPDKRTLGIMVKTTDEPIGRVYPDGSISKPVTEKDWKRLKEGSSIAREILTKAGAKSLMVSKVEGGHPGGTAAIGKVVDKNFQTKADGLFVCDASILPMTPGLPPILTIVALAKRLAKVLP